MQVRSNFLWQVSKLKCIWLEKESVEDIEEYAYQIVFFAYLHAEGTHKRYPVY